MQVEERKISDIRPYEGNPRQNEAAVDAVAALIREFGFRQPIVVDEEGVIVVAHTRYQAALKLGLEKVPVHVACGLTPEQICAYAWPTMPRGISRTGITSCCRSNSARSRMPVTTWAWSALRRTS